LKVGEHFLVDKNRQHFKGVIIRYLRWKLWRF